MLDSQPQGDMLTSSSKTAFKRENASKRYDAGHLRGTQEQGLEGVSFPRRQRYGLLKIEDNLFSPSGHRRNP